MTTTQFLQFLEKRIQQELPGQDAQLKMAPSPVNGNRRYRMSPGLNAEASKSGVILLLFPVDQFSADIILTLRTTSIPHGGQISFPGGLAEPGERPEQTALREMNEEIGISENRVNLIGRLSKLYLERSETIITPVVGALTEKPDFRINPAEVEEVFTVNIKELTGEKNLVKEPWTLRDKTYEVPYWNIHRRVPLWGATAMILSEFLELYREFQNSINQI